MGAALLLLATLTGPVMRLVADDDYPFQSAQRHETGGATVWVTVDPSGKTLACTLIETFGEKRVGEGVCDLLMHRRFDPARLADGTPAYARVRMLLNFDLPRDDWRMAPRITLAPDMAMHDPALPAAAEGALARVTFAVDAMGVVRDCAGAGPKADRALEARVCAQAGSMRLPVLTLPDGRVVPHVTGRVVVLSRG